MALAEVNERNRDWHNGTSGWNGMGRLWWHVWNGRMIILCVAMAGVRDVGVNGGSE